MGVILLVVVVILLFLVVRALLSGSRQADADGYNLIQSMSYKSFIIVGAILLAASWFFGDFAPEQMLRERLSLDRMSTAADMKKYSSWAFWAGLALIAFGALKALFDKPKKIEDKIENADK